MLEFRTMVEAELGIYVNSYASATILKRVKDISQLVSTNYGFSDIIPLSHKYQPIPNRVIVAGGEGLIRTILQKMHDEREIRPVGLLPGGSQNVLYNVLNGLGIKSDIKTFLEKGLNDYPEDQRLRPGMIDNLVFINHVGLGRFEHNLGILNAKLRLLPNGVRPLAAALLSLPLAALDLNSEREIFNLYTISPVIGKVPAFPDQNLLDGNLTHARVTDVRSLVRTLFYWQRGKPAPNGAMTQDRCPDFADCAAGDSIWVDGDTFPYRSQNIFQRVYIKRAPYGIPMVAIT